MNGKMKNMTIAEIDKAHFDRGEFGRADVVEYVKLWNETPGRFTEARIGVNCIYTVLSDLT
jgi:hypothetical protein